MTEEQLALCSKCDAKILLATAAATGGICMACKKGIRQQLDLAKATRRKKSPFNETFFEKGSIVAVEFMPGLWCYVRSYLLCQGFLPFFSRQPLEGQFLPDLKATFFFDLRCSDDEETPMKLIGIFPFGDEQESYGEPCYTAPDAIDNCFTIFESCHGLVVMRKTQNANDVAGMRLQKRYQPHQFGDLLSDKVGVWPTLPDG